MFGGLVFLALLFLIYAVLHGAIVVHLFGRRKPGGGRLLVPFLSAGLSAPILSLLLFSPWGAEASQWDHFDEYRLVEDPFVAFGVSWLSVFLLAFWLSRDTVSTQRSHRDRV